MRLKFLHTPKPKGYSYQPVYYNPDEEKQNNEKPVEETSKFRREMDSRWRAHRRKNRANTLQLMVYLLIILGLLYFIFFVW
ncbi:MAG: hypothetical protein HPY80_07260 [Bacteroidales bacterium]|jgi:hypothetical protein|nr:hypothetical protein [Bacteroidales bacterium]NPV36451.1 hypothetical protein [Bacteroidales bacterium]